MESPAMYHLQHVPNESRHLQRSEELPQFTFPLQIASRHFPRGERLPARWFQIERHCVHSRSTESWRNANEWSTILSKDPCLLHWVLGRHGVRNRHGRTNYQ